MGLFGFLSKQVVCPQCGSGGAIKGIFGAIKCPNISCRHYDVMLETELRRQGQLPTQPSTEKAAESSSRSYRNPRTGAAVQVERPVQDSFDPGQYAVEVRYVNFRGENKAYIGDWRTIRHVRKHLSLALAPTGTRVTFAVDRLQNRAELLDLATKVPALGQQHVIRFHQSRGTTSELYEQLRGRFPDWTPDG